MINTMNDYRTTDLFFESCVASYEACSIRRDPTGIYRLNHQDFPGRTWYIANLPTAHALCSELRRGRYRWRDSPDISVK